MPSFARIAFRLDAFCARLNAGLAAVAVMLAVITAAAWLAHHPEVLSPPNDPAESSDPTLQQRF
jgi:hypothetical protein